MVEELMLVLSVLFSPSKYGINDSVIILTRLHQFPCFLWPFIDDETFLFSLYTSFTFSGNEWQSIDSSSNHDTQIKFFLICTRWEKFLIVLIVLVFLLNVEDRLTSIGGLESILFLNAYGKQLLNIPIFWLSALIDMKSRKVLGNRREHQLNNEGIWKRHAHCLKFVCHVAHF